MFSDEYYATKFILYIPILFHITGGLACIAFVRWKWKLRLALALPYSIVCIYIFFREQPNLLFPNSIDSDEGTMRLVTYNVKSYSWGSDRVVETILDCEPDIFCPIEGTFGTWPPPKVEKGLGKDFDWSVGTLLSVASRYPVVESEQMGFGKGIRALRVVLDTPQGHIAIIAVDLRTPRQRDDTYAFGRLREILEAETLPAIVTGDLNVPRGSRQLARTMDGWTDIFETVGTDRYLVTWPYPFHLWQIDHAFCNDRIEPTSASIVQSSASDHLPLVINFKVRTDPP